MADLSKIKLNGVEYDLKDAFARDEFQNYVSLSNFDNYLHDADWSVKTMFEIREINNENRYIIRKYQSNDPLQKIAFLFSFLAAADTVFIYTLPNSAQLITLELKEIILGEGENIFNSVQSIILQGENNGNIYTFTFSEGMLNDENILIGLLNITPKITSNDIPVIPTNVSAFTNDAGYLTQHQNISTKANLTDLPLIVTGSCAFTSSLTAGLDTLLVVNNVSHTVAEIAAEKQNGRLIYFIISDNTNGSSLILQLTTSTIISGTTYYLFTNSYDPFQGLLSNYSNESFNITVQAYVYDNTDCFNWIITYNKNVFVTQSDMSNTLNEAIGGITEFDTQVVQTLPATGTKGTIYFTPNNHGTNDIYDEFIYVNNAWEKIGNTATDLTGYAQTNDLAYVAFSGDYENLSNKPNIPTKISDLTDDSDFITLNDVPAELPIVTTNDNNKVLGVANGAWGKVDVFDGNYNSLTNKPTLFSGSYNDLSDKPTIPSATTVTQTITSGIKIAEINGTAIYAPAYANGDAVAY